MIGNATRVVTSKITYVNNMVSFRKLEKKNENSVDCCSYQYEKTSVRGPNPFGSLASCEIK